MAASDCILRRILHLPRRRPDSRSEVVCRETLHVLDVSRYTRDLGASVYFPNAALTGDDLYDVTLSDMDCRLRVTLDPTLNRLVERNLLRRGAALQSVTLAPGVTSPSFIMACVDIKDEEAEVGVSDCDSLPWTASPDVTGPLRANRLVFLPLWNNVDFSGAAWQQTPPPMEDEEEEEEEASRPSVTVKDLRDGYLSKHKGVLHGAIRRRLIVRILAKSQLLYYGRHDSNCRCPYRALLEVCDHTGSVCVVLWNSVCVTWYRPLKPGDIISLSHFRVKQLYQSDNDDIEISVNSRNPTACISLLPESSVAVDRLPPQPAYSFYSSKELPDRPNHSLCDIIGLVTFTGRAERIRRKDVLDSVGGTELLEYRWLRLEDGTSSRPIWVKLFSTSQPETHCRLRPLLVVVCTRLMVVQKAVGVFYLTNTMQTQLYCTGQGHHSEMSYRKLMAVRAFLRWLKRHDEASVQRLALIGGFFTYPPPPVSLETYMKDRTGEPGFLEGAELLREMTGLCYRERRTFCVQATVTMVTYCRRGEEKDCIFWTSSTLHASTSPLSSPLAASQRTPLPLLSPSARPWKRKLPLHSESPQKGPPQATLQAEHSNKTVVLFEASMEFLQDSNEEDDDEDDDASSFATCPSHPDFPHIAVESLAMRYDPAHGEQQAVAVAMGGQLKSLGATFDSEDYYTFTLRVLSDGAVVSAIFLPQSQFSSLLPASLPHANTWISILSHGAFSSHTHPPSPVDLVATAPLLANQRLVCLLETCHLGGDSSEVILSRAFLLRG
ncbi:RPA-related protein RADX isoform X2 [Nerophis lumbriciformis]|uniref:RPA-related protein RADX isoform X2 n=1 Tax=Nerophis lumbriciformis TaxID=546530 RepID=UPI002AE0299C|nr:RPA-related protein RADX isoform X2 [Nerophis lumbriciformis]